MQHVLDTTQPVTMIAGGSSPYKYYNPETVPTSHTVAGGNLTHAQRLLQCPQQLPTPKGPILIKFSLKKDVVIDRLDSEGSFDVTNKLKTIENVKNLISNPLNMALLTHLGVFKKELWSFGNVEIKDSIVLVEVLVQGFESQDSKRIYQNMQDEKGQIRVLEAVQRTKGLEFVCRLDTAQCNHILCIQAHRAIITLNAATFQRDLKNEKVMGKMEDLVLLEAVLDDAHVAYIQALDDSHRIETQFDLANLVTSTLSSEMMIELSSRKNDKNSVLTQASTAYHNILEKWQAKDVEMLDLKKALALAECVQNDAALKAIKAKKILIGGSCPLLVPREYECQNLCGFRSCLEEVHFHETECNIRYPLMSIQNQLRNERSASNSETLLMSLPQARKDSGGLSSSYQASLSAARAAAALLPEHQPMQKQYAYEQQQQHYVYGQQQQNPNLQQQYALQQQQQYMPESFLDLDLQQQQQQAHNMSQMDASFAALGVSRSAYE